MRNACAPLPLLAAWLWLASAAAQDAPSPSAGPSDKSNQLPPAYATRQLDVEIPFTISAGSDASAQPTAVQVLVSWDFGRNWHKYTQVPADAGKFRFRAKRDAEFWFVTDAISPSGRAPSDAPKRPQMRLVIDTQKPDLQGAAVVNPAGQVEMTWSAADPHLSAASLKIEYQDARTADAPWEPVAIPSSQLSPSRGGLAGRIAFAPQEGLRVVNVRAEVADAAGNKSYFHQQLAIPDPHRKQQEKRAFDSPLAFDPGARRWPADNGALRDSATGMENIARPPIRDDAGPTNVLSNPHVRRDRLTANPAQRPLGDDHPSAQDTPNAVDTLPPPAEERLPEPGGALSEATPRERTGSRFPNLAPPGSAVPNDEPSGRPTPQQESPAASPRSSASSNADLGPIPAEGPLPPPADSGSVSEQSRLPEDSVAESLPAGTQPRLTNVKRFSLDYDVESVGPEGIAEVELWGTNDGGKTWLQWGADPDRTSPMEVEVSHEATYGFRVVILGKNGLEGNKPHAGDDADIWVSIDVTQPAARITAAEYGAGANAGKLDIRWEASDANLGPRPVTLLYSDRPDGKFTVIAAGLENSGQYLWQFDPRSPRTIYLRLEVRDEAGNVAADQLTDPISIEGLIPKGRIRGFSPAPEALPESGAFSSPLFR